MPDYNRGKIYKIWDIGYTKCYVGSTTEELSMRMAKHRDKYKAYTNGKYSFTSSFGLFDEFGYENCKIEWVENFPCNSRQELTAREGYYIRNCECINKKVAGRTDKDRYYENIEETETKANNGEKKIMNTKYKKIQNIEKHTGKK